MSMFRCACYYSYQLCLHKPFENWHSYSAAPPPAQLGRGTWVSIIVLIGIFGGMGQGNERDLRELKREVAGLETGLKKLEKLSNE